MNRRVVLFQNESFMSFQLFVDYLSKVAALSLEFTNELKDNTETEHYRAHQVFHAAGQLEQRSWFLVSGFARSYYFDQTGKEHTLNFYNENDIIFSYKGYWKETTDYYLEAVQESELLAIPYEKINPWLEQFPEMKTLTQVITRQRYHEELFHYRLMTWNAEERYHQFRKTHPEIFKKASVKLISTYLNMTRENLSRLMGK